MKALPWVGNKSVRGLGEWIVSLLPPAYGEPQAYVEPFAGMLGVLLARLWTNYEPPRRMLL